MGKRNTFLPYLVRFLSLLEPILGFFFFLIFSSLPALKRRTKRKGLPGAGSDSEEDPDGDYTGILRQRAARQAAAAQLEVSIHYLLCQQFIDTRLALKNNADSNLPTGSSRPVTPVLPSPVLPQTLPSDTESESDSGHLPSSHRNDCLSPPNNHSSSPPTSPAPPLPRRPQPNPVSHPMASLPHVLPQARPLRPTTNTTRRRIHLSPFLSPAPEHPNGLNPPDEDGENEVDRDPPPFSVTQAGKRGRGGITLAVTGGRGRGNKRRKY